MLKRLSISNYALIDKMEIDFSDGMSIITGETGAGKSIIIGALSLIVGQRADSRIVRDKEKKAVVEAIFDIEDYDLQSFFDNNGIDYFPKECIVRREVMPGGRNRTFVNDTPVALSDLSDFAGRLVDIHSQHSNALLLTASYQLKIIDNLADNFRLRETYANAYDTYRKIENDLIALRQRIEKNKIDEDYFRFQYSQLDEAHLIEGEQEELEHRKDILENLNTLKEKMRAACNALADEESSAIGLLGEASKNISQISGLYEQADDITQRIDSAIIDLKDICQTLEHDFDNLNDGEGELQQIDDRLSVIYSLQQKFRIDTVEGLIAERDRLRKALSEIENSEDALRELQKQYDEAGRAISVAAENLTMSRSRSADMFINQLKERVATLGLKNFQGSIELLKTDFTRTGVDKVAFTVAFNINQSPMPIEKTASGGEISRLMLAIKSIVAEKMKLPTIIFDEIDTGVSGEVAAKIGRMMLEIANNIQVVTITHLPQVAALGNHHFKVYKHDTDTETLTMMKQLSQDERVREIAGMLSGTTVDDAAIANAKSLLNNT